MAEQYTPSEEQVRASYMGDRIAYDGLDGDAALSEWTTFLARVRRDAAREFVDRTLLDWGIGEDEDSDLSPATAGDLRAAVDDTYPEESP